MDPRHLPVDNRLVGWCVFCGAAPGTSDHVPSKILLDDPLPGNLPTIEACATCNAGFSLDEEYLACFLECVLCGTTDPGAVAREKVSRALEHNSSLVERIRNSLKAGDAGSLTWMPEEDRVRRVVVKLARGHAAYELSLPQIEELIGVSFLPLAMMSDSDRTMFENAGAAGLRGWPEIGSRAFPPRRWSSPLHGPAWPLDYRSGGAVSIRCGPGWWRVRSPRPQRVSRLYG